MKAVRRLFVDQSCGFDSEYACVLEFVGTRYKIVAVSMRAARELNWKEQLDEALNEILRGNAKMKCPRCDSEMMEKRHKGHRRSFYECPNCHYNLTKMR
jgi:transposase-like protein